MGIPLPALGVRPPEQQDQVSNLARMLAIRNEIQNQPLQRQALQQEIQQRGLQTQQLQRQAGYEQNLQNLWANETAPTQEDILRAGGPTYGPAIIKSQLDIAETQSKLQAAKDTHQTALQDHFGNLANAIKQSNYDPQTADTLLAAEMRSADPDYAKNAMGLRARIQQNPALLKQITDQILAQSPEQQKQATTLQAANIRAGNVGLGSRIDSLNQSFEQRYQLMNPGKPLPDNMKLQPDATSKDFDRTDKLLEAQERSQQSLAQQQQSNQMRRSMLDLSRDAFIQRQDERTDKSYQFNVQQLNQIQNPIDQGLARIQRFNETLDQHNPQADALIAPELLSFMAGGQGSGVRQNQAELERIAGGRSALENLKASAQHWSLDPNSARTITTAQDQQLRALVSAVQGDMLKRQQVLSGARADLANPDATVEDHRKILNKARSDVEAMNAPPAAGGPSEQKSGPPAGATHIGVGSVDKKNHYLDANGNDLGLVP